MQLGFIDKEHHRPMNVLLIGIKSPSKEKRKIITSSVYFKAELKTTMLRWESKFDFFYLLFVMFLSQFIHNFR